MPVRVHGRRGAQDYKTASMSDDFPPDQSLVDVVTLHIFLSRLVVLDNKLGFCRTQRHHCRAAIDYCRTAAHCMRKPSVKLMAARKNITVDVL
jgi:hypothetical protein